LRHDLLPGVSIYLIADARPRASGIEPFLAGVIEAGVGMVQLRDRSLTDAELLTTARIFALACREAGALFIVNDRVDVALLAGADGVHVGQDDVPPNELRRLCGRDFLIGLSTHSTAQIDSANESAADYFGVGPIHETPTKPGRAAVGLELVRYAAKAARKPFFPIGGIDGTNVHEVLEAGAKAVSVFRCVTQAEDPTAAVRRLVDAMTASD
jgi:thiamine-phosphate pyrophosphorylase